MGIKSGVVTNLGRYKLSAGVGVVVAAVFRTSQHREGGGSLLSVYSSSFLFGADLCVFLSASLESIDLSLFCN